MTEQSRLCLGNQIERRRGTSPLSLQMGERTGWTPGVRRGPFHPEGVARCALLLLLAFGFSGLSVGCVEEFSSLTPNASGPCPEGTVAEGLDCRLPSTLVVGPQALSPARQGVPYVVRFEVAGGDGELLFEVQGDLPAGLSFAEGGLLSGVTDEVGDFPFTVTVTDGVGSQGEVELTLSVVAASGGCTPSEEVCGDGLDNDCDGAVDEGCEECVPSEEVCGDGLDNDCDDVVDEDCEGLSVVLSLDDVVVQQVEAGEPLFEVSYTTQNAGGDATGAYRDNIFLTRPDVPNDVIEVLGAFDRPSLGAGESRLADESFVMPDSVENGPWLIVVVIDRRNETGDGDQRDNVARIEVDYRGPDVVTCTPGPNARCAGADLQDAMLAGENLIGADFEGSDMRRADLGGANLSGASLRDANLRSATLRDAVLIGADLSGADLRGANLREADFSGANLRDTLLDGANMRGANLTSADMTGASAGDAGVRDVLWLNTTCPDGTISTFNGNTCEGHLTP